MQTLDVGNLQNDARQVSAKSRLRMSEFNDSYDIFDRRETAQSSTGHSLTSGQTNITLHRIGMSGAARLNIPFV